MERRDIALAVEGILFASGEPVPVERLISVLEVDEPTMESALKALEARYNDEKRGIRLLRVEESVQLCSAPEHAEIIRKTLEKRRAPQLSQAALEVLAIIAYFQPVTRAYIERVRGVDSSYTVGLLVNRGLVEFCGNLQVPGRPALFRTTKVFLRTFGLTALEELPPLPEAEEDGAQIQLKEAIAAIQEQEAQSVAIVEEQGDRGLGLPDENPEASQSPEEAAEDGEQPPVMEGE